MVHRFTRTFHYVQSSSRVATKRLVSDIVAIVTAAAHADQINKELCPFIVTITVTNTNSNPSIIAELDVAILHINS